MYVVQYDTAGGQREEERGTSITRPAQLCE